MKLALNSAMSAFNLGSLPDALARCHNYLHANIIHFTMVALRMITSSKGGSVIVKRKNERWGDDWKGIKIKQK